jgi:hypothetical protein
MFLKKFEAASVAVSFIFERAAGAMSPFVPNPAAPVTRWRGGYWGKIGHASLRPARPSLTLNGVRLQNFVAVQ